MKKNKSRLIRAIHFLPSAKKCLVMLILTYFALIVNLDAQTPKIWPAEISLNYEGGSSDDAITIKKNASTTISAPEYIRSESSVTKNENCAYIKSQSNRKIKVKFNSNNSNMNFLVKATVISGTGIGNICEMFVAPCDLNSKVFTIELPVSVPGSVGKRTFTWRWEATALPINSPYCPVTCTNVNTTHTYYTLLATPQAPMSTPWTEVLDYACVWAANQTTSANVAQKVTEGIYYMEDTDDDIDYDYTSFYCDDYDELRLSDFLYHIKTISNVKVNCTDCGNLVNVFTAAVGCQSHSKRIWHGISTKEIDPIGNSFGWGAVSWSYHQYGWFNDLVDDASLRLDRYGMPRVPTNMTQDNYNSLLIEGTLPANSYIYTTKIVD